MEPTNYPFRKESDLNQTSMIMCKMLIFRGVYCRLLLLLGNGTANCSSHVVSTHLWLAGIGALAAKVRLRKSQELYSKILTSFLVNFSNTKDSMYFIHIIIHIIIHIRLTQHASDEF